MRDDPIQEAVALLQQRRADLLRVLADVDRGIQRLTGAADAERSEPSSQIDAKPPSLREQILDAMPEPRPYGADEIVAGVDGNEASVRSILSRLTRLGDLRSPARGRYIRADLIPNSPVREEQVGDSGVGVVDQSTLSGVLPNAAQDDRLT